MKVWLVEFYTHYTKGYSGFSEGKSVCSIGETSAEAIENAKKVYAAQRPDYSFKEPFRAFEVSEILGYKITAEKI